MKVRTTHLILPVGVNNEKITSIETIVIKAGAKNNLLKMYYGDKYTKNSSVIRRCMYASNET